MPVLYRYNGTAFEPVGIPPAVVTPTQTAGQFNAGNIVEITNDTMSNAFPGFVKNAAGELLIVYRKSTAHNPPPAGTPGVLVTRKATSAKGTAWAAERTVYTAPTGWEARDPSMTKLADNRIAMTFFDYVSATSHTSHVLFSSDNGVTFSGKVSLNSGLAPEAISSPIIQLGNGNLLAAVYGFDGADTFTSSVVVRSTDGGATWARLALVVDGGADSSNYDEPSLVLLANGDLLCFIRNTSRSSIRVSRSTDSGATWTVPVHIFAGDSRVAVEQTANGALAVVYRGTGNATSARYCWGDALVAANWTAEQVIDTGFRFVYAALVETANNVVACVYAIEEVNANDGDVKIVYLYTNENLDPIA